MLHSKIESILKEAVSGNEELEKEAHKFHAIEREIDDMADEPEAELDRILRRAKELVERVLGGAFISGKWDGIERKIEYNLRELKEGK